MRLHCSDELRHQSGIIPFSSCRPSPLPRLFRHSSLERRKSARHTLPPTPRNSRICHSSYNRLFYPRPSYTHLSPSWQATRPVFAPHSFRASLSRQRRRPSSEIRRIDLQFPYPPLGQTEERLHTKPRGLCRSYHSRCWMGYRPGQGITRRYECVHNLVYRDSGQWG